MPVFDSIYQAFFNADNLKDGDLDLTVIHAEPKDIGPDGKKQKKLVLYFDEDPRGFILNKTNSGAKTVQRL